MKKTIMLLIIFSSMQTYSQNGKAVSSKAIALVNEGTKMYTKSYENEFMGIATFSIGEKMQIIKKYTEAIEIDSTYIDAYSLRGDLKLELGDNKGAIQDFDKRINLTIRAKKLNKTIGMEWVYGKLNVTYFQRGIAKYNISNEEGACLDWSKSGELGYEEAYNEISKHCH